MTRPPGKKLTPADIERLLLERLTVAATLWRLTPRHLDVLRELALGTPNKFIATALSCSERTVESHVAELRRRTGAASRGELIARFWIELL